MSCKEPDLINTADLMFRCNISGNLTNSSTGELEADILPGVGGEFGIISTSNGKFYLDVDLAFKWRDDQTFGFLKQQGIG